MNREHATRPALALVLFIVLAGGMFQWVRTRAARVDRINETSVVPVAGTNLEDALASGDIDRAD